MARRTLRIAKGLELPLDFATQGTAIIGVRGSGKSNTEVRFAELLHEHGIPFVAIDPKGDWHGIRMAGTGPGLPVPVFGGLYGDFPLDETLGGRIADLLVNENLSAVLDVSRLSKTVALPRFLTAFCDRLMDRHQQEPHVRTVILEEAHRYIPQNVNAKTAALKEAAASLLLEGRAFGLGCWACTQRPARLHNDVLEEVDTAVIHRIGVTATADLKRVREWVRHEDLGEEIGASLNKLANGEAWVLSPIALGIVARVQIDRRTTADTGATPTVGAKARAVATMADIDAPAVNAALADAIEKAQAEDPKALRGRLAEKDRDIARLKADLEAKAPAEVIEREVPVIAPEVLERLEAILAGWAAVFEAIEAEVGTTEELHSVIAELITVRDDLSARARARGADSPASASASGPAVGDHTRPAAGPMPPPTRPDPGIVDVNLTAGARRLLDAVAAHPGGLTQAQAATMARLKRSGGTFGTYLSRLRVAGLVVTEGNLVKPTGAGIDFAGNPLPPNPDELLDAWRARLGEKSGARRMLDVLVDLYPEGLPKEVLAVRANVAFTGGSFGTYLSKLRTNGLVVERDGWLFASPTVIEAAA